MQFVSEKIDSQIIDAKQEGSAHAWKGVSSLLAAISTLLLCLFVCLSLFTALILHSVLAQTFSTSLTIREIFPSYARQEKETRDLLSPTPFTFRASERRVSPPSPSSDGSQ